MTLTILCLCALQKTRLCIQITVFFLDTSQQYRLELPGCCSVRAWKKFGCTSLAFDNVCWPLKLWLVNYIGFVNVWVWG